MQVRVLPPQPLIPRGGAHGRAATVDHPLRTSPRAPHREHVRLPADPHGQGAPVQLLGRRERLPDRRERAGRRPLRGAAHLPARQRQPHGAADSHGRLPPLLGVAGDGGDPVLRLRPPGPQGPPRVPITAKLVCDLITSAGASRVLAVDLHAAQIQGFTNIPVDHLFAAPVLVEELKRLELPDLVMVSPDAGGVERARAFAKRLGAGLAIIDKRRTGPNQTEVMNIIGDVEGHTCVVVDDIIDTAGTLVKAADSLKEQGRSQGSGCHRASGVVRTRRGTHRAEWPRAGDRHRHHSRCAPTPRLAPRFISSRWPSYWARRSCASTRPSR